MPTHLIALIQGQPSNFGLTFPDVPGCVIAADINITIEEDLLEAIDQKARIEGDLRSGYLAQAARMRLGLR